MIFFNINIVFLFCKASYWSRLLIVLNLYHQIFCCVD